MEIGSTGGRSSVFRAEITAVQMGFTVIAVERKGYAEAPTGFTVFR